MCGDAHLRGREHQDDGHGALMRGRRVVVLADAGRSACSAVKVVAALSWSAW